ncbi:hypothetical protein [Aquisphaera giovannonii]|uniref:hypothetical protein n=1 Tax=Aquisphaera giovannonii TaxID=406548 RepID=UPI0011DF6531|nr:hypothetical protein [Aquisphaera giovannonii]
MLALLLIIGMIGGVMAWMTDGATWRPIVGFPALTVGSLGILLWSLIREDEAPDLMRQACGSYFERDGFCFAVVPAVADGQARLDVYFQNRFEKACLAHVAIRPSQKFFLNRGSIQAIAVPIECDGGAFGVARIPWGVPSKYQGQRQSLDVAASTEYPTGRGRMIRFRDGVRVGKATSSLWPNVLTVAAAATGTFYLSRPARLKFRLPKGVNEAVPEDARIRVETLWRPPIASETGDAKSPASKEETDAADGLHDWEFPPA